MVADDLLTLAELATYARCCRRTVQKWLSGPDALPHVKLPGKILVRRSVFDAWLERRYGVQTSAARGPRTADTLVEEILDGLV